VSVTVRVFLVDDHEIVRRGLVDLISSEVDLEVVGEAALVAGAVDRIVALRPDVVLLDWQLPDGTGVEICRDLRNAQPNIACLMLSAFADDDALFSAIIAGARGYVLKQIRGNELLDSIRRVAAGEQLLDSVLTAQVLNRLREPVANTNPDSLAGLAALSGQEQQILLLLAEGLTNREIGRQLFLAEKTIKNYVTSILLKLGVKRRTEAAVFVARLRNKPASGNAVL
jgi:two-component system, NarL family, response regulator DevR